MPITRRGKRREKRCNFRLRNAKERWFWVIGKYKKTFPLATNSCDYSNLQDYRLPMIFWLNPFRQQNYPTPSPALTYDYKPHGLSSHNTLRSTLKLSANAIINSDLLKYKSKL
ncbi:MAG: hypothetical protein NZ901_07235 [Geminocystis sp.]|nr:hypothetical protein [Geminocystis sp.]MDW8116953.1 hypothetical protein [Geminocystis sp.]